VEVYPKPFSSKNALVCMRNSLDIAADQARGYYTRTAPIAQLDRVLPSEGKGHWFESSWVRHKINDLADILDA
jgi:hypothetical protein